MHDFLKQILDHKKKLNHERREYFASIRAKIEPGRFTRYSIFKKSISDPGAVSLIAEIKKASPSQGLLREDFDLIQIAKTYEKEKAAAISVLTEDKYFFGKPAYVKQLSEEIALPLLTKDFILDEGQVYEARLNGASAILLIVGILDESQLQGLMKTAHALDLDCLVEVHTEDELKLAVDSRAEIIGINNRDLHTFDVNIETSKELLPKIPKGVVSVAESGIHTHQDVLDLQELGADAVLIGEAFMRVPDIGSKIRDIMYG